MKEDWNTDVHGYAEAIAVAALAVVLAWAARRPRGLPEAVAAVPAAALVACVGAVTAHAALAEVRRLAPVVGFLACVLVLAKLCDDDGLFRACGAWLARGDVGGSGRRLLTRVFAIASVTTAVLSLDATVVLLTPVVLAAAARTRVRARPHAYACGHLANSASLLLPVSNLTNLLAFAVSGLSFGAFAALMALPWAVAIGVEYAVLRRFFAADLGAAASLPVPVRAGGARDGGAGGGVGADGWIGADDGGGGGGGGARGGGVGGRVGADDGGGDARGGRGAVAGSPGAGGQLGDGGQLGSGAPAAADVATDGVGGDAEMPEMPVFTLVVVGLTLCGFVVASAAGANPAWAALGGAIVLGVRALARRETTLAAVARSADVPFLLFVLGLGVVVAAVVDNGLGSALRPVVPSGTSLPALLAIAALAAVLANLVNNLPAVLVLLPLAAPSGAGAVLAVLMGVNIGPNLTYTGSLATLLWRRVIRAHGSDVSLGEFTRLGVLTVVPGLLLCVVALWLGLQVGG